MNNKDRRTFQLKFFILSVGCALAVAALVFFLAFRSDTTFAAGYERSAKSSSSARQTAGNLSEISGTLRLVWADGGGGGDHHAEVFVKDAFIIASDQRVIAIEADNLDLLAGFSGREVVARGYLSAAIGSDVPALRIDADSIQIYKSDDGGSADETTAAAAAAEVSGNTKWATLMLKFADVADEPKDKNFFERIVTGSPDSLDRYWREMSYGRINLDGSKAFGWLTLPKTRDYYFYDKNGDGVPELDTRRISQDGTETAINAGVPVGDFYGVNFALNADAGSFASGGFGYALIGGQYVTYSATYLPLKAFKLQDVFAHEMGHGYGFSHSLPNARENNPLCGQDGYDPCYNSSWDVMSGSFGEGDYFGEFGQTPVGTIAKNRHDAGWLAPGREQTTGKAGEFTFELVPLSREGGTAYIKVPIRGVPWGDYFSPHFNSGSQFGVDYYTVEAREQTGFDRNIPADAVVIHKVTGNSFPPASVVTTSADGNPNDAGGQWTEGESFEDQSAGISIQIKQKKAAGTYLITVISKPRDNFSFDPGGRAYLSVFRPENNTLYRLSPSGEFSYESFGIPEDRFAVGDYDGDGISDPAVFRPSSAWWYIQRPDKSLRVESFGATGDAPAAADYDGDGKTDIAVFRPQTGVWYIKLSSGIYGGSVQFPLYRDFYIQQFGIKGDVPAPADYDGDGKADLAVYRPETGVWYVKPTNTTILFFDGDIYAVKFGQAGDIPVSADYDGDRITDFAVYRPETGVWYVFGSKTGFYAAQFGTKTDIPVAADYDGDGKTDLAVFRPETGVWYYLRSSTGGFNAVKFGQNGDRPLNRREK